MSLGSGSFRAKLRDALIGADETYDHPHVLCCLLADVVSSAILYAGMNRPGMQLWNEADGSLWRWNPVERGLGRGEGCYLAGPFVLKMRRILLYAFRGARTDGPSVTLAESPLTWPDCQGGYCEVCFERHGLELRDDMTQRERTLIWHRCSQLGMEISAFEA